MGAIRGVIHDQDFDTPLSDVQVMIAETGERVVSVEEGNYVFSIVKPGRYTLVFSKDGYARLLKSDVIVSGGQMTEIDASLSGEFEEMEEFIAQDMAVGGASEVALLNLRMEAPMMMDSISAELMSASGASDAAGALRLVTGATVQDGRFAVIRGLPDRYVNSQMNGVRLPTADADKRAVQLDQFPAAVIDSIQVTKTFTPDQQGDASGGVVNVVLKGIPDKTEFKFSAGTKYNTQVTGRNDFLTYKGGGVNCFGRDDRDVPSDGTFGGAAGTMTGDAPFDYKWALSGGGKHVLNNGVTLGGFGSFYYERDSDFYDDGIDDSLWLKSGNRKLTPQADQGGENGGDFVTKLWDVTQSNEEVRWGTLGVIGAEIEDHTLSLLYMYTRVADDTTTLAEDTRGKEFFFPGHDPNDPQSPGNLQPDMAPYLRTETLKYTERTTQTLQLSGTHKIPTPEFGFDNALKFMQPEFDWTVARSSATLDEPDKRQFGEKWWGPQFRPGIPAYGIPDREDPAKHLPFKPAANINMGNFQRVWKDIREESDQFFFNLKMPFEQWTESEGYFKFGFFHDNVTRTYNQDSFGNFGDNAAGPETPFSTLWTSTFLSETHPITAANIDVDYDADQRLKAWYAMMDMPLSDQFNLIGGIRWERTDLSIIPEPEAEVDWVPAGATGSTDLKPGDADVDFRQDDWLPAVAFSYKPIEQITIRGSYSETVARQTFKELTPIIQQEYLGGEVFIGNPALAMSSARNYDLRFDYNPYEGGLVSFSWFYKDITDPIEYVQRIVDFGYTTPVNYPDGRLNGIEFEARQDIGRFVDALSGLSLGGNLTLIDSKVTLPRDEQNLLASVGAPTRTRDMSNAPEYLYNLYLTYDLKKTGTNFGLFYTVKGDTLVAGAGQSKGNFVPSVYQEEYGTLNLSVTQKLHENWKLKFQAKNLTNPVIREIYRSKYIDKDTTRTSHRKGVEFSLSLSASY